MVRTERGNSLSDGKADTTDNAQIPAVSGISGTEYVRSCTGE
jgi:hypothetical protein